MSAATSLPWFAGVLNRAQLTQWRIGADRLSASQLSGISYPRPDQVALLCETLINAIDATQDALTQRNAHDDTDDMLEGIETLSEAAKDAAKEASKAEDAQSEAEQAKSTAEDRADELQRQVDSLQGQLDNAEERIAAMRRRLAAFVALAMEGIDGTETPT